MKMDARRKRRAVNWEEDEKQLLREVIRSYHKQIESRSLKTSSQRAKTRAWQEIHIKFNALNIRQRELQQLQCQWKGMKINARKEIAQYRLELSRAGDGPKPRSPSRETQAILDLMNPSELEIDANIYDSDAILNELKKKTDSQDEDDDDGSCDESVTMPAAISRVHSSGADSHSNCGSSNSTVLASPTQTQDTRLQCEPIARKAASRSNSAGDNATYDVREPMIEIEMVDADDASYILHQSEQGKLGREKRIDSIREWTTHSRIIKNEEHKKRMKIMELEEVQQKLKIQQEREKLMCIKLEKEILEIKLKELKRRTDKRSCISGLFKAQGDDDSEKCEHHIS